MCRFKIYHIKKYPACIHQLALGWEKKCIRMHAIQIKSQNSRLVLVIHFSGSQLSLATAFAHTAHNAIPPSPIANFFSHFFSSSSHRLIIEELKNMK